MLVSRGRTGEENNFKSKICGQKRRKRTEKENKVNIWSAEEKKESFCSIYDSFSDVPES